MAELRCDPGSMIPESIYNVIHYAMLIPPLLVEKGLEQKKIYSA